MRTTLRRSCDACARSKLRCDLLLPQCSRCSKRSIDCLYANEPLSASLTAGVATTSTQSSPDSEFASFDPFDSYPKTRLPRAHVQRLIQHFLSSITFQYYPLDMDASSNPFVTSWFPLALADPALFHVSLQTASLDVELRAQQGFPNSDILMVDSVSLLRRKVQDPSQALRDETLDSVVTLAAIEFGKGNVNVGQAHIDGVKSMIRLRGGIQQVKMVSPLTARMVAWVAMIVQQAPQFMTQDDSLGREGIAPPPKWHEAIPAIDAEIVDTLDLNPPIDDILGRLRFLFRQPGGFDLTTTDFHDLTCFVLHRLLDNTIDFTKDGSSLMSLQSEMTRYAIVLYLLLLHGPTYFSHARLQYTTSLKLKSLLEQWMLWPSFSTFPVTSWLLTIGLAASESTPEYRWFSTRAQDLSAQCRIFTWEEILLQLQSILWFDSLATDQLFRSHWEGILEITSNN
ncbi:hypothetical protein EK21DRAFT_67601 [Setomelanomma holmii]|uniref:Zn(2)-C6 fungal-type domain-containing protein n=1 Tax=Setomelanomma holmii TaxID=210430 RepID=A0A9P4H7C7_9PLEO|nr:hypothetical protein EK21DRAFT_67601 [Setomelanomma holmii]